MSFRGGSPEAVMLEIWTSSSAMPIRCRKDGNPREKISLARLAHEFTWKSEK